MIGTAARKGCRLRSVQSPRWVLACHAIELDPAYVDVAVLRWQEFTGDEATLEGDGRSFAEAKARRLTAKAATGAGEADSAHRDAAE